jgi:uncharacterized protein with HEPN domain
MSRRARGSQLVPSYLDQKTRVKFALISAADFRTKIAKQDAVIRHLEILGEATAHLNEATRLAIPELPFRKMRGTRNIVAHDYANVDLQIVWEVATVHVPNVMLPKPSVLSVPSFSKP